VIYIRDKTPILCPINIYFLAITESVPSVSMHGNTPRLTLSSFECLSLLEFLQASSNNLPAHLQALLSKLQQLFALGPHALEHPMSLECTSNEQHLVGPVVVFFTDLVISTFSGAAALWILDKFYRLATLLPYSIPRRPWERAATLLPYSIPKRPCEWASTLLPYSIPRRP